MRNKRWAFARSLQWSNKDQLEAGEDYVEKKAHKWAKQIFKNLRPGCPYFR